MAWYIYSILTSLSFVGMILSVRWLTNKGFPPKQILLFLIGFAFLGFFFINFPSINAVWNSEEFLGFLLIMAFAGIFSVIGNWSDFEAIKKAPNPGFPVAVRNSNILAVLLLSVLIFGSEFSFFRLMGILFVVIGMGMLIIEKSPYGKQKTGFSWGSWQALAFIALFGFTLMTLGLKQATIMGFSSETINFFLFGFNFLAFAMLSRKELGSYVKDKNKLKIFLPVVFLASAFSFVANFLSITGLELAPNPGYHEAIKNTNTLFVALLSIPLFSSGFDKKKFLGVVAITIGAIILVI